MARIRTIKPEFWLDEDLAELPPETRLLAIGLLNHSDDEGYFKANHMIIRAAIFPFTDNSVNVQGMLTELSKIGYLRLFSGVDGKQYGQIVNFLKHQKVNKPSDSKIKGLEDSRNTTGILPEDSTQERKGKEQGTGKGKEHVSRELLANWFEELWSHFDTALGQKGSKKKALAQFLRIAPDEPVYSQIAMALQEQVTRKTELKDRNQFYESFPHVERWLRDERWNDELPEISESTGNTYQSRSDRADQALKDHLSQH